MKIKPNKLYFVRHEVRCVDKATNSLLSNTYQIWLTKGSRIPSRHPASGVVREVNNICDGSRWKVEDGAEFTCEVYGDRAEYLANNGKSLMFTTGDKCEFSDEQSRAMIVMD